MKPLLDKVKKCWENIRTNEDFKAIPVVAINATIEQTIELLFECLKHWLFNL